MNAGNFCKNIINCHCKVEIPTARSILSDLAHPVNHAFSSMRHRLVSFRQKFGQNREVLHWILCTFRVGLNIDNVGCRMPGKILLEGAPGAGQDPAASIETGDRASENKTSHGEGCGVAA